MTDVTKLIEQDHREVEDLFSRFERAGEGAHKQKRKLVDQMIEALSRQIPGVVQLAGSVENDSFRDGLLDYPHYTRPEDVRGMGIPEVLLSGHHEKIRRWRKEQSLRATLEKRPDLLETAGLDDEAREILRRLGKF